MDELLKARAEFAERSLEDKIMIREARELAAVERVDPDFVELGCLLSLVPDKSEAFVDSLDWRPLDKAKLMACAQGKADVCKEAEVCMNARFLSYLHPAAVFDYMRKHPGSSLKDCFDLVEEHLLKCSEMLTLELARKKGEAYYNVFNALIRLARSDMNA